MKNVKGVEYANPNPIEYITLKMNTTIKQFYKNVELTGMNALLS